MGVKEEKKVKLLNRQLHHTYTAIGVFGWRASPNEGTDFKDVLDPAFWDNVQAKFRVNEDQEYQNGQKVQILPDDKKWFAEVLALRLRNGNISIRKLSYVSLESDLPVLKREDFKIEFKGNRKNCIIRAKDGYVIEDQIESKAAAEVALDEYIKAA